jgi:catechol 2,3-dioxygenase-like lactoylglutathione lyase family enzyme
MEHVTVVVDDLAAAAAFFAEHGARAAERGSVDGAWAGRVVGLEGVRVDYAMMDTPDGDGRIGLVKFHAPPGRAGDPHTPANTPGLRHLAFSVANIDADVAGLCARGCERVGEVEGYRDIYPSALLPPRPRGHHRRARGADRLGATDRSRCR